MIEHFFDKILEWVKSAKYIYLRWRIRQRLKTSSSRNNHGQKQSLEVYSDPSFVPSVSRWGEKTAWSEILYLLVNCRGKILDIACGPGTIYPAFSQLPCCDYFGCDISEYLIKKAAESGVPATRLKVCDATQTPYEDNFFDYSYSIGSLEHFTEEGIERFLKECHRITKGASFHQIPISRSGQNEGWLALNQSYFNNSVDWWLKKYKSVYKTVRVLDSMWEDPISLGKWFICLK